MKQFPSLTAIFLPRSTPSTLGWLLTYHIFPVAIFMAVVSTIAMPSSTEAAGMLYLYLTAIALMIGFIVSRFQGLLTSRRVQAVIYAVATFAFPFTAWKLWTLTL